MDEQCLKHVPDCGCCIMPKPEFTKRHDRAKLTRRLCMHANREMHSIVRQTASLSNAKAELSWSSVQQINSEIKNFASERELTRKFPAQLMLCKRFIRKRTWHS